MLYTIKFLSQLYISATEELRRMWKKEKRTTTRKSGCDLAAKINDSGAAADSHKNQPVQKKSRPSQILSLSQGAAACVQR